MKIIVCLVGFILICFIIYWFFFTKSSDKVYAKAKGNIQKVNILVKGGYTPDEVILKQNIPAILSFQRMDASSCLDQVIFPELGISQDLPQKQLVSISIDTNKAGTYQWHCSMNMFHGKIIIKKDDTNE